MNEHNMSHGSSVSNCNSMQFVTCSKADGNRTRVSDKL